MATSSAVVVAGVLAALVVPPSLSLPHAASISEPAADLGAGVLQRAAHDGDHRVAPVLLHGLQQSTECGVQERTVPLRLLAESARGPTCRRSHDHG